jgi:hypothetical protein
LVFQNDFDPSLFIFVNESYYRNKYAKLGGKIMDYVLRDIGEHQFFDYLKPKSVQESSELNNETHGLQNTVSVEKPETIVKEKVEEQPKEDHKRDDPKTVEDSMKRLDDIIKDLERHTKK